MPCNPQGFGCASRSTVPCEATVAASQTKRKMKNGVPYPRHVVLTQWAGQSYTAMWFLFRWQQPDVAHRLNEPGLYVHRPFARLQQHQDKLFRSKCFGGCMQAYASVCKRMQACAVRGRDGCSSACATFTRSLQRHQQRRGFLMPH